MSTIKYTGLDAKQDWLFDAMDASVRQQSATKVVWQDNDTGQRWILQGSNLQLDEDGDLAGGTVTRMQWANAQGKVYVTYSNFTYEVPADKALFETNTNLHLAVVAGNDVAKGSNKADFIDAGAGNDKLLGKNGNDSLYGWIGDDIIKAGNGDDFIWGKDGDDRLTGGAGKDQFQYVFGDGHDIITDFNAKEDVFYANWDDIASIQKSGHDTIINWSDGGSMTLLDVNKGAIHEDLFF